MGRTARLLNETLATALKTMIRNWSHIVTRLVVVVVVVVIVLLLFLGATIFKKGLRLRRSKSDRDEIWQECSSTSS